MEHVAQRLRTRDLTAIAACAALMAVCAWIAIPTDPPFTLQTLAVFLAVGLLGGRRGTIAVGIYLLMGAVGLPVFAGFGGGLGILMGTTGGYIWGFLGSALVMWAMERILGTHLVILLLSMLLGLLVCYAFGTTPSPPAPSARQWRWDGASCRSFCRIYASSLPPWPCLSACAPISIPEIPERDICPL